MSSDPVSTAAAGSTAVAGDQPVDVLSPRSDPVDPRQIDGAVTDAGADAGTVRESAATRSAEPVVVVLDDIARHLARAAAVAEAGNAGHIGEFLLAHAEDDVAVTATFSAQQAGYLGWTWSVTLALLDPAHPTVSEVVLLPGDGALLAPAWIPWDERIRPGDLGVGDLLPPTSDDPRVVPAYLASDDPAVEALAREIGIGRVRVLSREGRVDFAERLHEGTFGPTGEMALAAPAHCVSCAFYLPLAGSLGRLLGACGNEYAPADGRVVDAGYGCGAHSETVVEMPARSATTDVVIDELSLEVHRRPAAEVASVAAVTGVADAVEGSVADVVTDEVEIAVPDVDAVDVDAPDVDASDVDASDVDAPDVDASDVDAPDVDAELLDEWADPYAVGLELAEVELAEAALLDSDGDIAPSTVDAPSDLAPSDFVPSDLAPSDFAPAELAPAELAPAELAPASLALPGPPATPVTED